MSEKILVIDDEEELRELVSESLQLNDFETLEATNGKEALEIIKNNKFDCVISDIEMPEMTGVELLKEVKKIDITLPVIMLTGVKKLQVAIDVMKLGAQDYLVKPINIEELLLSINRGIEYRRLRDLNIKLQKENEEYQKHLEEMVQKRTLQLEEAIFSSLLLLTSTIEAKDPYTKGHSNRVRLISMDIAKKMNLSKKDLSILEYGSMLHDIGKIGIKDDVLLKKGALNDEEFEIIKSHPSIGAKIIANISFYKPMIPCVKHHHEKYNGRGYPDGLKGEEIQLLPRIIAVADTYDAMTSTRPYRNALPKEKALSILKEIAGTQLDKEIVDIFISNKIYNNDYIELENQSVVFSSIKVESFIDND